MQTFGSWERLWRTAKGMRCSDDVIICGPNKQLASLIVLNKEAALNQLIQGCNHRWRYAAS